MTEVDPEPGSIAVAVVDDQQIVLTGVAGLVAAEPDLRVAGTATDLAGAIDLIERTKPDVVLADIQLGEHSGLSLLDHFQGGRPPIILLSAFEHPSYYEIALERGASGYVLKAALVDQLVAAIRTVAAGGIVLPAQALRGRNRAARRPSRRELLTPANHVPPVDLPPVGDRDGSLATISGNSQGRASVRRPSTSLPLFLAAAMAAPTRPGNAKSAEAV